MFEIVFICVCERLACDFFFFVFDVNMCVCVCVCENNRYNYRASRKSVRAHKSIA